MLGYGGVYFLYLFIFLDILLYFFHSLFLLYNIFAIKKICVILKVIIKPWLLCTTRFKLSPYALI
jgi:hypothetical protein